MIEVTYELGIGQVTPAAALVLSDDDLVDGVNERVRVVRLSESADEEQVGDAVSDILILLGKIGSRLRRRGPRADGT